MKIIPKLFRFAPLLSLFLLCACASQPSPDAIDPPGFFLGYWNGLTIFFALIGHIFDDTIRVYAFPNSGGWYDFGYFLGCATWGSGSLLGGDK